MKASRILASSMFSAVLPSDGLMTLVLVITPGTRMFDEPRCSMHIPDGKGE